MHIPRKLLFVGPSLCFVIGVAMNAIVMAANGGTMPVLYPSGCSTDILGVDLWHSCFTHATHLKILCDWIPFTGGVYSLGDCFIELWDLFLYPALAVWIALLVSDLNRKNDLQKIL